MATAPQVSVEIGNAIIIDDSVFSKMSFDKKEQLIKSLPAGKQLTMVQSFMQAKNITSIKKAASEGKDISFRMALVLGRELTEDEAKLLSDMQKAFATFSEMLEGHRPAYPFEDVPDNKSIDTFVWNKSSIKRNRSDYAIKYTELERVWKIVSQYWASPTEVNKPTDVRAEAAAGYKYDVDVKMNRLDIGCQHVYRWELEQIARKLGWEFPGSV